VATRSATRRASVLIGNLRRGCWFGRLVRIPLDRVLDRPEEFSEHLGGDLRWAAKASLQIQPVELRATLEHVVSQRRPRWTSGVSSGRLEPDGAPPAGGPIDRSTSGAEATQVFPVPKKRRVRPPTDRHLRWDVSQRRHESFCRQDRCFWRRWDSGGRRTLDRASRRSRQRSNS
jgi:hypothetical protein